MIQGTGSGVGKSAIVAGLCRLFARAGVKVAPFKAQNMALNSYVTKDGGEIGRAQAVQAFAARVEPTVDMNPILLKPTADTAAQVILRGRPVGNYSAISYHKMKNEMRSAVARSLERLSSECELLIIEGAGSPAEVNLKDNDIANMAIARMTGARVFIVGDIDKGGVFASLIGTLDLLTEEERALVSGFIINKFRGDRSLLAPGLQFLEDRTGVPITGVVPHIDVLLEQEDSAEDGLWARGGEIEIAVVRLPRMSNFTDFNALALERGVSVKLVKNLRELGWPDAVVIPGSKNTLDDMAFLHSSGLAQAIKALASIGAPIIGICGGYQMLGKVIRDEKGVEARSGEVEGLGLLDVRTELLSDKVTRRVRAAATGAGPILSAAQGRELFGYEIHAGRTALGNGARPAFEINGNGGLKSYDGAVDESGLVFGTYLHGIFDNAPMRNALLSLLRQKKGLAPSSGSFDYHGFLDDELDRFADCLAESLDIEAIHKSAGISASALEG